MLLAQGHRLSLKLTRGMPGTALLPGLPEHRELGAFAATGSMKALLPNKIEKCCLQDEAFLELTL